MNPETPTVSIAIRAYRRSSLRDAIASVLGQTYCDFELVIYDDAGDLRDVVSEFLDKRICYHRAERSLGASGRFSAAAALCRGRYIGMLDDDDCYEPEFVARLLQALEQDPKAGVVFCRTTWECGGRRFVPADPRPAGCQQDAAADMISRGWIPTPSVMLMRRVALDDVHRTQAMPDGVAPDVFLNIRIAVAGWRHVLVDGRLVVCGWHAGRSSLAFPVAHDIVVATWQKLELHDPELTVLRDQRLALALLHRSVACLRAGEWARARADLRAAAEVCPLAWRGLRRLLRVAASCGPVGVIAAMAWWSSPRARRRRALPPPTIVSRYTIARHTGRDASR
jgi:glycosyltransferase involved in cell wall biosynthesis